MLKRWNLSLIIGTFLLSIFGTFITRSGVIASVHSFTQSNVGYFFLGFLVLIAVVSYTLLYTRWPLLEAEVELESMLSREAAFLFNNLLLVGIAFSVLWGTLFPILSEAVRGTKITVGPPFFNRVNVPARPPAAGAHRHRAAHRLAEGLGAEPAAPVRLSGWRGGRRRRAPGLSRHPGAGAAHDMGAGGLRGRDDRAGVLPRHPRPHAHARRDGAGGAGAPGGPQPPPLWRLHRPCRACWSTSWRSRAWRSRCSARRRSSRASRSSCKSPFGHTYTFTHVGISQFKALNRVVSAATIEVARDGVPDGRIVSEKRQHSWTAGHRRGDLRAVDRSGDPQRAAGGPLHRLCRVRWTAPRRRCTASPSTRWSGGCGPAGSSWRSAASITMWPGGATLGRGPPDRAGRLRGGRWSGRARSSDGSPPLPRVPPGFHARGIPSRLARRPGCRRHAARSRRRRAGPARRPSRATTMS